MKGFLIRVISIFSLAAVLLSSMALAEDDSFNKLAGSIYMRDIEKVRELINGGVDVNIRQDKSGSSPLMVACAREGTDDIIEFLLSRGAEVNVKGNNGYTPLMWAAENSLAAVNMLIAGGARADAVADDGMTTMIKALFGIFTEDVTTEVCDTLLAHGADINAALSGGDTGGLTALLFAANKQMPELVEYLVSKGADVNHQSDKGETALMRACTEGDLETVKILIAAGADPSLKAGDGSTALSIAEKRDSRKIAEYLKSL